jgi:hypothetical protein
MTKRESDAERKNDARTRAAMKEWAKTLGHKPTPEDKQRALVAAAPAQRKHDKKEFERGKKDGYSWAESGRSIRIACVTLRAPCWPMAEVSAWHLQNISATRI